MKKILFLSICFALLGSCNDGSKDKEKEFVDNRKNAFTLKDYNLKGKIDSVHIIRSHPSIDQDFNITLIDSTKQLTVYKSYHFNKKGQLLKTKFFTFDSIFLFTEYHNISENGKIIDFIQEGEIAYSDTIIKNTETELFQLYLLDDTLNATLYWFYENDKLLKDSNVYTNGEIEVYNYIYNDEGLMLSKELKLNFPDLDEYLYDYKYLDFDDYDNWTKRIEYNHYSHLMDSSLHCILEERTIFYSK